MPGGISGLFNNTRGAKAHREASRKFYDKEIHILARRWRVSLEKAFETIMKRIDAGLAPLPELREKGAKKAVKKAKPVNDGKDRDEFGQVYGDSEKPKVVVDSPAAAMQLLENAVKDEIGDAVAGHHYDLEKPINETIELIELIVARSNLPRVQAYLIGNAAKYILRAGIKTPDWGKDIAKAENYLHRALNGKWNSGK